MPESAHLLDLFVSLLNGLGLIALVAVLYGSIARLTLSRTVAASLYGLAFGFGALVAMTTPAVLVPGILVDGRATFVASAGAFVGPLAAIIAATIAGLYRVWLGGAGVAPGLVTIALALAVGIVWRYAWFKRRPVTPFGLALLGLGISLQNVLILFLPVEMTALFMLGLGLAMTVTALFATLVLGGMMHRENRLIAREKALIDDAFTDPLTSLPNRRALYSAEPQILSASAASGYTVLVIDIDHFKSINDRFGHDVGDAALRIVASVLKLTARSGDTVARFGGEEFVIVLPATRAEDGMTVASRLLQNVRERRIVIGDADFSVTVSIGLAHARRPMTMAEAIARADTGLYRAKGEGRDRVVAVAPPVPAALQSVPASTASARALDPRASFSAAQRAP